MPNWMKKTLVTLITVLTFGLVSPPAVLLDNAKTDRSGRTNAAQLDNEAKEASSEHLAPSVFLAYAKEEAQKQSMMKFGSKIGPAIEEQFENTVLPRMEAALEAFAQKQPSAAFSHFALSQRPKSGDNEKIFHLYDTQTGKDLLRFHVRCDHPPKDGYYFDFHYHSSEDNFVAHRELGKIYWGKNHPPQWLS
jgi:hypothetical protein